MTFKHQSPFKEGEVSQILQNLRDSDRRLHEEEIAERDKFRAQFGGGWFASVEAADAPPDQMGSALSALDSLLTQHDAPAKPYTTLSSEIDESITLEPGLFAGEPSYTLKYPELHPGDRDTLPLDFDCPQQQLSTDAIHGEFGVNAKTGRAKQRKRSLCTPGRAGLVAGFHFGHAERVAAISELHPDLDQDQIQALLKIDAFIQKLMRSYQGTGELPDWAKFVTSEMKQFFRLYVLCRKSDAKTITIRLDHDSAEAALGAPRGPANYLAEIIKRTLAKLGIETNLAFNLEFNHTGSTENHPAHIHGALCIPDDRVKEVSEALRNALAEGYRQRYTNLAVHVESPRSAHCWAAYCIKEYDITAIKLTADRGRKTRPDYANQKLTQEAKAFYDDVSAWLRA
ncbi:hypothetical protein ACYZTR_21190 [Pseudomonas sp. Hz4]